MEKAFQRDAATANWYGENHSFHLNNQRPVGIKRYQDCDSGSS